MEFIVIRVWSFQWQIHGVQRVAPPFIGQFVILANNVLAPPFSEEPRLAPHLFKLSGSVPAFTPYFLSLVFPLYKGYPSNSYPSQIQQNTPTALNGSTDLN